MTISPERERQLLASVEYPPAALRAIQFLLTRVRELEAEIAATDILLVSLNEREDDLTNRLEEIANLTQSQTAARIAREALKGTNDEHLAR